MNLARFAAKRSSAASSGSSSSSEDLPGWDGAFGVDFSGQGIGGTCCANCRSLAPGDGPPACESPVFIGRAVPGKKKGEKTIPVASGKPGDYCCNAWGLSKGKAK